MTAGAPRIYEYEDYRAFLRDHCAYRRGRREGFSYGVLARKAGVSRSHPMLVAAGRRPLTEPYVDRYAAALGLSGKEAQYFRLLVAVNDARSDREREAAERSLRRWRTESSWKPPPQIPSLSPDDLWLAYLILGTADLDGFRRDPAWIARRLAGRFPLARVRRVLGILREGMRREGADWMDKAFSFRKDEPSGSPASRAILSEILQGAADPRARAQGFGDPNARLICLSRAEALELSRLHAEWMAEHLPPKRKRSREPRELCVVFGDIYPVTALRRPSGARRI